MDDLINKDYLQGLTSLPNGIVNTAHANYHGSYSNHHRVIYDGPTIWTFDSRRIVSLNQPDQIYKLNSDPEIVERRPEYPSVGRSAYTLKYPILFRYADDWFLITFAEVIVGCSSCDGQTSSYIRSYKGSDPMVLIEEANIEFESDESSTESSSDDWE